jgi:hypothetical protein
MTGQTGLHEREPATAFGRQPGGILVPHQEAASGS